MPRKGDAAEHLETFDRAVILNLMPDWAAFFIIVDATETRVISKVTSDI